MKLLRLLATIAVLGMFSAADGNPVEAYPVPSITDIFLNDREIECFEATPTAVHAPTIDPEDAIDLDVALVADRLSAARAQNIAARAAETFAALNVRLEVVSTRSVTLSGTELDSLMSQTKQAVGGTVPAGADVVVMITSVEIEDDGDPGVAGFADCIGGVRYDNRGFVVLEDVETLYDYPPEGFDFGPVVLFPDLSAKLMAHEVGHLVGNHHHYANCAEGLKSTQRSNGLDPSACTVMFPYIEFLAFNFGTLEANIARGHIHEYARP